MATQWTMDTPCDHTHQVTRLGWECASQVTHCLAARWASALWAATRHSIHWVLLLSLTVDCGKGLMFPETTLGSRLMLR